MAKLSSTTATTDVPATDANLRAEQDFLSSFEAKLDAADTTGATPAAGESSTGTTPSGTTATEDQDADEATADTDATDHDDDEAEEGDEGDEDEEAAEGEEGAELGEDESAEAAGKEKEGKEGEEEEVDDETAADTAAAKDVQDRLVKAGLKLSLKDIPAEARPLVQKKLDHAQAAITRVLQEATAFRAEKQQFIADQKFRDAHPELVIAEMLAKNPELSDKVNEHIEKLADPDKKKLFEITLREERKAAVDSVLAEARQSEVVMQRADEIEAYTRRACDKLGLPIGVVEQAIALEILNKPADARDLTEQELDTVITRQARLLKGHTRATNLGRAKEEIRARTRDRRTTTPAVRTGSGVAAPSPAGKVKPKNDAEFTAMMEAKL
ncbi:MAG: hypothetical protein JWM41_2898 [Gemmatimonadetes bacterium]|nr:hypothetical protein [Gemmatimonadota bacterium]